MQPLSSLKTLADSLPEQGVKMPVLFVGHGSPMNAIEDNEFTARWRRLGQEIPQPKSGVVRVGALAHARHLRHGHGPAPDHSRLRRLSRRRCST